MILEDVLGLLPIDEEAEEASEARLGEGPPQVDLTLVGAGSRRDVDRAIALDCLSTEEVKADHLDTELGPAMGIL